jgi:hypothetical protein
VGGARKKKKRARKTCPGPNTHTGAQDMDQTQQPKNTCDDAFEAVSNLSLACRLPPPPPPFAPPSPLAFLPAAAAAGAGVMGPDGSATLRFARPWRHAETKKKRHETHCEDLGKQRGNFEKRYISRGCRPPREPLTRQSRGFRV